MKTTRIQNLMAGALVGVLAFTTTTTTAVPASSAAKAPALEARGGELLAEQCRSENEECSSGSFSSLDIASFLASRVKALPAFVRDKHNV